MDDDDGSLESIQNNDSYEETALTFVVNKPKSSLHGTLKTVAGVAGNVLEWYDFAGAYLRKHLWRSISKKLE